VLLDLLKVPPLRDFPRFHRGAPLAGDLALTLLLRPLFQAVFKVPPHRSGLEVGIACGLVTGPLGENIVVPLHRAFEEAHGELRIGLGSLKGLTVVRDAQAIQSVIGQIIVRQRHHASERVAGAVEIPKVVIRKPLHKGNLPSLRIEAPSILVGFQGLFRLTCLELLISLPHGPGSAQSAEAPICRLPVRRR
jgi:hypothetical protein